MIDFTKKNLFKSEDIKFRRFLDTRLETFEEHTQKEIEEEENAGMDFGDEDMTFSNGMDFDFNDSGSIGGSGFDFGGGFGGMTGGAENSEISEIENDRSWEKQNDLQTFLTSFLHLIRLETKHLMYKMPEKSEWDEILQYLEYGSASVGILGLLFWVTKISFWFFSPVYLAIYGILFTLISEGLMLGVYHKGIIAKFLKLEPTADADAPQEDSNSMDNGFGGFDDTDDTDMGGMFGSDGDDTGIRFDVGGDDGGLSFGDSDDEEEDESDDEEFDEEDEKEDDPSKPRLQYSDINISDNAEFKDGLVNTFKKNAKYAGKIPATRLDLLNSFSNYLITGDKSFGKYKILTERGSEYNNVAYALYKGISAVSPGFNNADKDGVKPPFIVKEIRKSPLLYIIKVNLPEYLNSDMISKKINLINDVLKNNENDDKVSVLVSSFSGDLVFKFLRFDAGAVSLGDILRYDGTESKTTLEQYLSPKLSVPCLIGLENNEYPSIIDLEGNTSGIIIGGSGSGKSWTTFEWMWNFVLANDPREVQFMIFDAKDSNFWRQFAIMPHILAIHSDPNNFIDFLNEVEAERLRRQKFLQSIGEEDVKGARKKYKKVLLDINATPEERANARNIIDNLPLLTVIIDEITATREIMRQMDEKKEHENAFKSIITGITAKGRSAGVRLLQIGQRSVDESIAKGTLANSSIKFGMKMEAQSDFGIMFGKDVDKIVKPNQKGQGLIKTEDSAQIRSVKTLTLGARDDGQMTALIRTVAFDWLRRVQGVMDLTKQPAGTQYSDKLFNRPETFARSVQELKEGKLFSVVDADPSLALDLTSDTTVQTSYQEPVSQTTTVRNVSESPIIEAEPMVEEQVIEDNENYVDNSNNFTDNTRTMSNPFEAEESTESDFEYDEPEISDTTDFNGFDTASSFNEDISYDESPTIEEDYDNATGELTLDDILKNNAVDSNNDVVEDDNVSDNNKQIPNIANPFSEELEAQQEALNQQKNALKAQQEEFLKQQQQMIEEQKKLAKEREAQIKEMQRQRELMEQMNTKKVVENQPQTVTNEPVTNTNNKQNTVSEEPKAQYVQPKEPMVANPKKSMADTINSHKKDETIKKAKAPTNSLSIDDYIMQNGKDLSDLTKGVLVGELEANYNPMMIKQAIAFGDIVKQGEYYVVSL